MECARSAHGISSIYIYIYMIIHIIAGDFRARLAGPGAGLGPGPAWLGLAWLGLVE